MDSAVDKSLRMVVSEAKAQFGVEVGEAAREQLAAFVQDLLKWNRRFNLTAITAPDAVAELHLLDSLSVLPHIGQGLEVLDVGSGGGFPGIPLAILRPDLRVRMVDRTEKKIAFLKVVIARLGLRAEAVHQRLEGRPDQEGLGLVDVAVARAFAAPLPWFSLARNYLREGGRAIAMLGSELPDLPALAAALQSPEERFRLEAYRLPSGAARATLIWDR